MGSRHFPAESADRVERDVDRRLLDFHRREKDQPPAETLAEQLQPQVFPVGPWGFFFYSFILYFKWIGYN